MVFWSGIIFRDMSESCLWHPHDLAPPIMWLPKTYLMYEKNEPVGQLEQEEKNISLVVQKSYLELWNLQCFYDFLFLLPNYPILGLLFKKSIYVFSTKIVQMFLVINSYLILVLSRTASYKVFYHSVKLTTNNVKNSNKYGFIWLFVSCQSKIKSVSLFLILYQTSQTMKPSGHLKVVITHHHS